MITGISVVKGNKLSQDKGTGEWKSPSVIHTYPPDMNTNFVEMAKLHGKKTVTMTIEEYEELLKPIKDGIISGIDTTISMLEELTSYAKEKKQVYLKREG